MARQHLGMSHYQAQSSHDAIPDHSVVDQWADKVALSAPDWMEDKRPSVLVIADADAQSRLRHFADAAGARCLGWVTPVDAAERLARCIDVDLILFDAVDAEAMDAVLPHLAVLLRQGDTGLIVTSSLEGVDTGFAFLAHHALLDAPVQWLCAPDDTDWATALVAGLRRARGPAALHDIGRESDSARLARLSEEVDRLARALDALRRAQHTGIGNGMDDGMVRDRTPGYAAPVRAPGWPMVPPSGAATPDEDMLDARTVRDLLRSRRLRDQFFTGDLFADPAWDMMLDLMAARLAGERVSVSSLCIAAAVPPTTALRWIRHLTEQGIFARQPDPLDGRRVFIALSEDAALGMQRWYAASRRARREGPL